MVIFILDLKKSSRLLLKTCGNKNHFTTQNISDLDTLLYGACVSIQLHGCVFLVASAIRKPPHSMNLSLSLSLSFFLFPPRPQAEPASPGRAPSAIGPGGSSRCRASQPMRATYSPAPPRPLRNVQGRAQKHTPRQFYEKMQIKSPAVGPYVPHNLQSRHFN